MLQFFNRSTVSGNEAECRLVPVRCDNHVIRVHHVRGRICIEPAPGPKVSHQSVSSSKDGDLRAPFRETFVQ